MKHLKSPALAVAVLLAAPAAASAIQLNTGGETGAYHTTFCPALEKQLSRSKFDYKCTPSDGTADNLSRVAADPRQIGYGQLDVFAFEAPALGGAKAFTRLRTDDVRECVFAVTRNHDLTSYGDIAVNAGRLRFVLPPKTSGSTGTFRYLQEIDADGLGKAKSVIDAKDVDDAIKIALSADDTVAFFVQFPDPDNPRFKNIQDLDGHIVPVIDRSILRSQVEGQKIYFAQETQIANAKWMKGGQRVVTSCTPLVLFTGTPERVTGDRDRQDHKDMIATVQALKVDALVPRESTWSRLWRKTRELTGQSVEKLLVLSQEAREKAKPMVEKAKELSAEAYEKAKKAAEEAMQKKPEDAPKPQ